MSVLGTGYFNIIYDGDVVFSGSKTTKLDLYKGKNDEYIEKFAKDGFRRKIYKHTFLNPQIEVYEADFRNFCPIGATVTFYPFSDNTDFYFDCSFFVIPNNENSYTIILKGLTPVNLFTPVIPKKKKLLIWKKSVYAENFKSGEQYACFVTQEFFDYEPEPDKLCELDGFFINEAKKISFTVSESENINAVFNSMVEELNGLSDYVVAVYNEPLDRNYILPTDCEFAGILSFDGASKNDGFISFDAYSFDVLFQRVGEKNFNFSSEYSVDYIHNDREEYIKVPATSEDSKLVQNAFVFVYMFSTKYKLKIKTSEFFGSENYIKLTFEESPYLPSQTMLEMSIADSDDLFWFTDAEYNSYAVTNTMLLFIIRKAAELYFGVGKYMVFNHINYGQNFSYPVLPVNFPFIFRNYTSILKYTRESDRWSSDGSGYSIGTYHREGVYQRNCGTYDVWFFRLRSIEQCISAHWTDDLFPDWIPTEYNFIWRVEYTVFDVYGNFIETNTLEKELGWSKYRTTEPWSYVIRWMGDYFNEYNFPDDFIANNNANILSLPTGTFKIEKLEVGSNTEVNLSHGGDISFSFFRYKRERIKVIDILGLILYANRLTCSFANECDITFSSKDANNALRHQIDSKDVFEDIPERAVFEIPENSFFDILAAEDMAFYKEKLNEINYGFVNNFKCKKTCKIYDPNQKIKIGDLVKFSTSDAYNIFKISSISRSTEEEMFADLEMFSVDYLFTALPVKLPYQFNSDRTFTNLN